MPEFWKRFRQEKLGLLSFMFIAALLVITFVLPAFFNGDPRAITDHTLQWPSLQHVFGTDEFGRDVFQLMTIGIRVSLFVGLATAVCASVVGVAVGAWAGFHGGKVDLLLMRVSELFQVIPVFVLAAIVVSMLGQGLGGVILVIASLSWPQVAVVMRSEVTRITQADYVNAVRCLGYSEFSVMMGEVIPNAVRSVTAVGTLIVGQAILTEAALSYLGLSNPDVISWGAMLNSGQRYLMSAWWLSVLPGMAIFLTVLAFNLVGDAVDVALNPGDMP